MDGTFLRSKLGRRIFYQFVLCAVFPIVVLAVISFSHVKNQLNKQSQRRLHQTSKSFGFTIYERLLFLEAEMRALGSNLSMGMRPQGLRENLTDRFHGLSVINKSGMGRPFLGVLEGPPQPNSEEREHLSSGKTVLSTLVVKDQPPRIFMSRSLDLRDPDRGILVGEINPTYLWGLGDHNTLPPLTELCVLDPLNRPLICSVPELTEGLGSRIESASGQFEWSGEEQEYLARYWSIPLRFQFFVPKWTVVLSESKSEVFAPMADFQRIFPLVLLTSLLVVLLLSIRHIRRSLVPLEKLKEGARRIASRDFTSRVEVHSDDEFQELSDSFNGMAGRLDRQFSILDTVGEIDRAILSVLDIEKIVGTVLNRWPDIFPCDYVSVSLLDPHAPHVAQTYLQAGKGGVEKWIKEVRFMPQEIKTLCNYPAGVGVVNGNLPPFLASLSGQGAQSLWVLPIVLKEGLSGILCMGFLTSPSYSQEDLGQARRLADQVAVALSNAREVAERQRAQDEVKRNLDRLVALRDIDLAVTSTLDLETLLDLLLQKIEVLLPNSASTIWLLDKKDGSPKPVACRNFGDPGSEAWKTEEFRAWGGVPNAAFEKRGTVKIDDLRQARIQGGGQDIFCSHGLISYLGVPLIAKGEFLGALSVYMKEEHPFSIEEVDFYSTLAGQGAIAIHNSQLYEEKKIQAETLARANRVKKEFLSVMSHELRTPLSVIMGFTETMQDGIFGKITRRQKDSLSKMAKQSQDLLTMINSIMEATRIESEALVVVEDDFVLGDILNELRSLSYLPLMVKDLSITWDFPSERVSLSTDRGKIKSILQNLIHNGLKFTDKGGITVSARYLPVTDSIEFRVADTGIGIPHEALPIIFEKFAQTDSSETRSYGGVGLGLYIVKSFSELLGGAVKVESEPGLGSTFTVRLPATYREKKKPPSLFMTPSQEKQRVSKGGASRHARRSPAGAYCQTPAKENQDSLNSAFDNRRRSG